MSPTLHPARPDAVSPSLRSGLARVLPVVGLLIVVPLVGRLARRRAAAGWPGGLAVGVDRALRHRFLGARALARRSGVRAGQQVLLLGIVDRGVIQAFAQTVGRSGRIESLGSGGLGLDGLGLDGVGIATAASLRPVFRGGAAVPAGTGLPFAEGSLDAVCLVSALGRATDSARLLAEARRVLRPAGRLSVSDVASHPGYRQPASIRAWCDAVGLELFEQFGNALAYTLNGRKPMRRVARRGEPS